MKKTLVVSEVACNECGSCEKVDSYEYPYLSCKEVNEKFLDKINISSSNEKVKLEHALNRVTSCDINSLNSVPSSNRASHDGIAVNYQYFKNGMPDTSNWELGKDYIKSSMGTHIPDEFDTLIRDEKFNITLEGNVEIDELPKQGQSVSQRGSSLKDGEKILSRLTTLNPRHLSMLRMGGVEEVDVIKKPRVAIIPTGSEIVEKGNNIEAGYTVDSNSILIKSYLDEWGAEPTIYPIVKDNVEDLETSIKNIIEEVDMILIIGGVGRSKGYYDDYTVETVEKIGRVVANGVHISPGRPVMVGFIEEKPVVGVPGPPHAAIVINDEIVRPALKRLIPHVKQDRAKVKAVLMHDYKTRLNGERYNRVYVKWNGNNYEAHAINRLGDTVDNFINASGVVCYSSEVGLYSKGQEIEVELLYTEEEIKTNIN